MRIAIKIFFIVLKLPLLLFFKLAEDRVLPFLGLAVLVSSLKICKELSNFIISYTWYPLIASNFWGIDSLISSEQVYTGK